MTYNQGYTAKQHSVPVKRYCQTLNLKNNPALIAEYRKIHSKKEAWPEVSAPSEFWKWKYTYQASKYS